jgi:hypothetical protein
MLGWSTMKLYKNIRFSKSRVDQIWKTPVLSEKQYVRRFIGIKQKRMECQGARILRK